MRKLKIMWLWVWWALGYSADRQTTTYLKLYGQFPTKTLLKCWKQESWYLMLIEAGMCRSDKVLIWPGGWWHRYDPADPDALEDAIHDNGQDYHVEWLPDILDDEAVDKWVHEYEKALYNDLA